MAKQICPSCVGAGKSRGMGYIMQDCTECDGIGYLTVADKLEKALTDVDGDTVVKVRKSRRVQAQSSDE